VVGVLILEEELKALEIPLNSRNIRVDTFSANAASVDATDQEVFGLLSHRVRITDHSKDFLEEAVIHEFGIFDTEQASQEPEKLTDIIARKWLAGSLRGGRRTFVAQISADGSVSVREIEE
jgi:hypothetical protein